MKKWAVVMLTILMSINVSAKDMDLNQFAKDYFKAFVATQQVDAKAADLEQYLDYLTDDVGTIHIPFNSDDSRHKGGKDKFKESMSAMMGKNTEFKATIEEIRVFNTTAILIRFKQSAVYVNKEQNTVSPWAMMITEILEMDGDKVGLIRRYHD
ncbi:nuclear transport factor 2 family protein [Paraglaciecola sp.]|uniref:nuclear transport factor 2 family protein n=1 Tax=Paraglaciecola sp. TaxID=1920173 RepID=UPI003EF74BB1